MDLRTSSTLALSATLACTIKIDDDSGTPPETQGPGTDTGNTSTPPPTSGTTAEPTSASTSGPTPTSTSETGEPTTGELPPEWCNGFDPDLPYALTINNGDYEEIQPDGSLVTLECGGQGLLMFPIFPHFGGFIPPDGESVTFSVTLDVEDFNVGPNGHFFETIGYSFEVDCSYDTYGYYSNSFVAMFPPDSIPDITAVNGKPGVLHVTLHAPMMDLDFDANVVMKATEDDFGFCGYSGTDSDSETGGSSTGGSTGGSSTGGSSTG